VDEPAHQGRGVGARTIKRDHTGRSGQGDEPEPLLPALRAQPARGDRGAPRAPSGRQRTNVRNPGVESKTAESRAANSARGEPHILEDRMSAGSVSATFGINGDPPIFSGFSAATGFFGGLLGGAIRAFTGGDVNHAFFVFWSPEFNAWLTVGANGNGVTVMTVPEFCKTRKIKYLFAATSSWSLWTGLRAHVGDLDKHYNYTGLFGMANVEIVKKLTGRPARTCSTTVTTSSAPSGAPKPSARGSRARRGMPSRSCRATRTTRLIPRRCAMRSRSLRGLWRRRSASSRSSRSW
jgi:hypothetical protein